MEIIPPIGLTIPQIGDEPEFVDPLYVINTYYDTNDRVRRLVSGGWYSYRARGYFYSNVGPIYLYTTYYWEFLGPAATEGGFTFSSGVTLSLSDPWESGSTVNAGESIFDIADQSDYSALVDIDAGDNTIRPSDAVLSSDEDVAGRWRKINAANAWGAIDYGLSTATLYIDEDGNNLTGEVWTNYSPVEPSENKIAEPYKFDVGWTTFNVTVAADVVQQPSLSANSSADRITASALVSPSNLGYLYRTYSVEQGERRFFAVYVKSTNHTTFKVQFLENDVSKAIETFTISSNWTYIQAYYEVSATSTLKIRIGLIDTPSRSLDLWYAHLGEVTAAIDRVALLLLTNIKTATLHILPWADVENSDWGIGSSVTHNCPAPTRPDLSSSSSMVCSIFKDDSTTIQSNTGDFYPVENTLFRLQVQVRDPNKPPASIGELVLGKATTLGGTEWGVESSILSFSRKERDDTFGTVTFVKRGSARQVRATAFIDTDIISGDTVYHTLASFDGVPVCWDFNNPGSDFDRLRVFGFHTNVRTLIQTNSWESLSIDIEGLVE